MVKFSGGREIISLNRSALEQPKAEGQGVSLLGSEKCKGTHGNRSLRSQGAPSRSYGSGGKRGKLPEVSDKDTTKSGNGDPIAEKIEQTAETTSGAVGESVGVSAAAEADGTLSVADLSSGAEEADRAAEVGEEEADTEEDHPAESETEECGTEFPGGLHAPDLPEEEASEAEEVSAASRSKRSRNRPLLIFPAASPDKIRCL